MRKQPKRYTGWRDARSAAVLAEVRRGGPSAPLNLRPRARRCWWRRWRRGWA